VGRFAGGVVLVLDSLKGWVAVAGVRAFAADLEPWVLAATGAAAILGHVFSPFLMFRGGKGVATSAGVIGALAPRLLIAPLSFFVIAFALKRRVSVASLIAAMVLPIAAGLYRLLPPVGWPGLELLVLCPAITLLLLWTHRGNVRRLRLREEPELGS
jgi:glycerol-3-phosphate acyltransferase PlsY